MAIDWKRFRVDLAQPFGRVRCEKGWAMGRWARPIHNHDLWFIWAGRGRLTTRCETVELRPGMCVWMRPGGQYEADQENNNRLGVSYMHFNLVDARGKHRAINAALPPEIHVFPDFRFGEVLWNRVINLMQGDGLTNHKLHTAAKCTAQMLFTGLLMDLDSGIYQTYWAREKGTQLHHKQLILKLASSISENPAKAFCVSRLARHVGYSADHFTRVFKSIMGLSPQAYILQARINRACQLLLESSFSVCQIADLLNYRDAAFFSKQFKKKMGLTPGEFRQKPYKA